VSELSFLRQIETALAMANGRREGIAPVLEMVRARLVAIDRDAVVADLTVQVATLTAQVAELQAAIEITPEPEPVEMTPAP
jgi:hypothetical protein